MQCSLPAAVPAAIRGMLCCMQVWSLSSSDVSCQVLRKRWIKSRQFPCVWLPWQPSPTKGFLSKLGPVLTQAVLLSFAETTKEPGFSQWKSKKKLPIQTKFWPFHLTKTRFLDSFREWQWDGPIQQRAPSQLKKPLIGEGRWGSHEQGTLNCFISSP